MIRLTKDNLGFTLIELMMTVAVLGIFFAVVYGFLNSNLRFLAQRGEEHDACLQARIAMYRVSSLLQQYEKITIEDNVVKGDEVYLVNLSSNDGSSKYYFDGTAYQLRDSSEKVIADGIKVFTIDPPSGNVIKITVQAVPAGNPGDPGLTLSTKLRADRHYTPNP
jgi:prepilin-type N-terminal cleavage/methylation domain-containing protein